MNLAYSTNAYLRCTMTEAIDRVAALGYAGVELMADVPHLWPTTTTPERIASVRARLGERGLAIANLNAFMMTAVGDYWHPSWIAPDADARRFRLEHTCRALHLAAELGAPSISTEPGGPLDPTVSRSNALGWFVEGLQAALEVAERVGVHLLVEPEPALLVQTADEFVELAEMVRSPMFGLNFDVGHFFCVADPLPETVRRLAPFTRHYHVEDIAADRVHQHLVPGQGAIDFAALFAAIRETGYDGWITVELYPCSADPDAAGRQAGRYLRAVAAGA
jgi:sugar phosphate isomerase/epimerase